MQLINRELFDFRIRLQRLGLSEADAVERSKLARRIVKHFALPRDLRDPAKPGAEMERLWYASLEAGKPDFGVYDHPDYVADLFACWWIYSRGYLRAISRNAGLKKLLEPAKVVVDLGCGLGLTTTNLARMFRPALVFGTNLPGTFQSRFANLVSSEEEHFEVVDGPKDVHCDADVVFASEYFEHFERPVEHLVDVLELLRPRFLIVANSFGTTSIGHFRQYTVMPFLLDGRKTSKAFNDELRRRGYEKIETGFWNNRPAVWRKKP
jgi:SAM-dependent methyltransferase